jgi:putative sterol carrier protein
VTSAADYFQVVLPERFAAMAATGLAEQPAQEDLSITYELTGNDGCVYGMRVAKGKLDIIPGGIRDSDMRTIVDAADWRATHVTAWEEPLFKFFRTGKVAGIKKLNGNFKLDLRRPDAPNYRSATIFGGETAPEVTLRMHVDDYVALATGDLSGHVAYMVGKMRFDGNLPFLLKVALST